MTGGARTKVGTEEWWSLCLRAAVACGVEIGP